MHFLNILGSLLGAASLTKYVAADLRIRADHFSFGGVNYPGLQFLERAERDQVIKNIVKSGARVIRLFSRKIPICFGRYHVLTASQFRRMTNFRTCVFNLSTN